MTDPQPPPLTPPARDFGWWPWIWWSLLLIGVATWSMVGLPGLSATVARPKAPIPAAALPAPAPQGAELGRLRAELDALRAQVARAVAPAPRKPAVVRVDTDEAGALAEDDGNEWRVVVDAERRTVTVWRRELRQAADPRLLAALLQVPVGVLPEPGDSGSHQEATP